MSYVILSAQAIYDLRTRAGIQKIELQTLVFGGTAAGFVTVSLMFLAPVLGVPALSRFIPIVIVVFYCFTAWGITTQKIFDARDMFRSGIHLAFSIGIVAIFVAIALEIDPWWCPAPWS